MIWVVVKGICPKKEKVMEMEMECLIATAVLEARPSALAQLFVGGEASREYIKQEFKLDEPTMQIVEQDSFVSVDLMTQHALRTTISVVVAGARELLGVPRKFVGVPIPEGVSAEARVFLSEVVRHCAEAELRMRVPHMLPLFTAIGVSEVTAQKIIDVLIKEAV